MPPNGWRSSTCPRRAWLPWTARSPSSEAQLVAAASELTKARSKAAKGLAKAVTTELAGLAMTNAVFTIGVGPMPARADDSAPVTMPDGEVLHAGHDGVDAVEFGFTAHRGADAAAGQERLRR